MPFEFLPQKISDVILIKPVFFKDDRGFFVETYKESDFIQNGIKENFVQDNYSKSFAKVLRGLHYQKSPYSQAKLVRCVKGEILDVAVDIRPESPTFKQHIKVRLTEDNQELVYIPKGFAHGYVVLSDTAEIHYKTSAEYNPSAERGILWNDEEIGIDWGIDYEPVISLKDKSLPKIKEADL